MVRLHRAAVARGASGVRDTGFGCTAHWSGSWGALLQWSAIGLKSGAQRIKGCAKPGILAKRHLVVTMGVVLYASLIVTAFSIAIASAN